MTIKEELHQLVDQLPDEEAADALAYVRRLHNENGSEENIASARLSRRMGPLTVSGPSFFRRGRQDLQALAVEQGVRPIESFDDLRGDFWPEDESIDDFVAAVREWRRGGSRG